MKAEGEGGMAGDRHVLLAVDNSENSERAVLYVADFLGGGEGFRVTVLNVVPEPPPEYFETDEERTGWIEANMAEAEAAIEKYKTLLVQSGFEEGKVSTLVDVRQCPSVAECILDTQRKLDCCTIVIGRRGISKKEEFLFGSTSSRVVHSGKNCAVWVIE